MSDGGNDQCCKQYFKIFNERWQNKKKHHHKTERPNHVRLWDVLVWSRKHRRSMQQNIHPQNDFERWVLLFYSGDQMRINDDRQDRPVMSRFVMKVYCYFWSPTQKLSCRVKTTMNEAPRLQQQSRCFNNRKKKTGGSGKILADKTGSCDTLLYTTLTSWWQFVSQDS